MPYDLPNDLPTLPDTSEVPFEFSVAKPDGLEETITGTPRTANYTMYGEVVKQEDDTSDEKDEKKTRKVSYYIRRERPSDGATGVHGAIVLPIIKDSTGTFKTILSAVPRGGTKRVTLELPAYMAWSDEGSKKDRKTIDKSSRDTELRALRMKTGLGTAWSIEDGFSKPKLLQEFGSMAIHPGTENTRKTLTAFATDFSGELRLDGSNLPTRSEESKGEIIKDPGNPDAWTRRLVVPLDQLSECLSAFQDTEGRDVDVSLGAMAPLLTRLSEIGGLSGWYASAKPLEESTDVIMADNTEA